MFCALKTFAQTELKFDKKIIDCEDKWIALSTEHGYAYGFVYLDNSAGLTLFLNGGFSISENNTYVPADTAKRVIRVLLNVANAALIPREKYGELHLPEVPSWLVFYRTTDNNVDRIFRLGYIYNRWRESKKALEYLKAVRKIDNKYPGLDAEFSLAYRQQGNYQRADAYTDDAIKGIVKRECEANKRQIFAFTAANEMNKAENAYVMALRNCNDEMLKAELAYNIAFHYYKLKDKTKFKHWQNQVNRWVIPQDIYTDKMKMMAANL